VSTFSDGEVQVEIEENVRRQEVFVIQPTCAPTAENFMELLVHGRCAEARVGRPR
jgi:ribose-phosphate pyrophosphokinase